MSKIRTAKVKEKGKPSGLSPRRRWGRPLLGALAIAAITAVVYWPSLGLDVKPSPGGDNGFIWDDNTLVTENALVRADDGLKDIWLTTKTPDYFPLTYSSFWLEWRLWGTKAVGYHANSILQHIIASLLIWLVLARLNVPGAFLAALVFAIHPVNMASVAWVSERKNTLSIIFFLLTILAYLRFLDRPGWKWYAASLVLFVLAMLCKTSVIMLPVALLVLTWWRRRRLTWKDVLAVAPLLAISLGLGLLTIHTQRIHAIGHEVIPDNGFFSRLAGAGWALWFYIYKDLLPLNLCMVYPRWDIDPRQPLVYLPGVLYVAAVVVLWLYRRSWGRGPLTALVYMAVMLLPVLGFFNMFYFTFAFVADHWQHLSIIAVIALAVGSATYAVRRWRGVLVPIRAAAATAAVAALAAASWHEAHRYVGLKTLWTTDLERNPRSFVACYSLGALAEKARTAAPSKEESARRLDEMVQWYQRALRHNPKYGPAQHNLAAALLDKGDLAGAWEHCQGSLKYMGYDPDAHSLAGLILTRQAQVLAAQGQSQAARSKIDEALTRIDEGLAIESENTNAVGQVMQTLRVAAPTDIGVRHYRRLVETDPNSVPAHLGLGRALSVRGQYPEAMEQFRQAIRLDEKNPMAHEELGGVLAKTGQVAEAEKEFIRTLALRPQYSSTRQSLGTLQLMMGKPDEAIANLAIVVRELPKNASSRYALGIALARKQRWDEAGSQFREALNLDPNYTDARQALEQVQAGKRPPSPAPGGS